MNDTTKSKMRSVLRNLNMQSGGDINASAAMTTDGFMVASQLQETVDEDRFAAMCASLLALANQTTAEISLGDMRQLMIMGTTGIMLLTEAGPNTVLSASALPKASMGKVLLDTRKAAAEIARLVSTN